MIVAGIDYSITSPAIVIADTDKEWCADNCQAYYFDDRKNAPWKPKCRMELYPLPYPLWKTPEERYEALALWASSILIAEEVGKSYLESYALSRTSSSGLIFNIAENGGVLKNHLHVFGLKFRLVTPTDLKKWSVGNGKAPKEMLEEQFIKETGIDDIRDILMLSEKASNPISDIIDAYYLCKYAYHDIRGTLESVRAPEFTISKKKKPTKEIDGVPSLKPIKPIRYKGKKNADQKTD